MAKKNEKVEDGTEKEKKEKKERPPATFETKMFNYNCKFQCEVLGTWPQNEDLFLEQIIKKLGSDADKEKVKDELASLPIEDVAEKGKTVFARDDDGNPILLDYQFKGFLKESFRSITERGDIKVGHKSISSWTIDRIIDKQVFVYPREIALKIPEGKSMTECTRPLRANTMKGPRISLACSEQLPRGTEFNVKIEILMLGLEPFIDHIMKELCVRSGIGQWRNSGKGKFVAELVSE